MKCYQAKAQELAKHWYVIDAENAVVGRLAAQIAPILMGKHRPTYTPYLDTGDYVIVTNVDKVVFTGEKWRQKFYQRYSGHPGGQKEEAAWKLFERQPERILHLAIQRMMPKNKIGRHMLLKLKLCVGPNHPHQAQCPIPLAPKTGRPTPAGAVYDTTIPADIKAMLEKIVAAAESKPGENSSLVPAVETIPQTSDSPPVTETTD
jgi:large subunit ribosomal protein L13